MTHITPLAALYLLLGLASAVTLALRRDIPTSAVELGLLCLFWPLYGPFVLLKFVEQEPHRAAPGTPPKSASDLQHDGVERVLEALRRAGDAPLASLLPDVHTGRKLAGRLHTASEHVAEIDALLKQPEYDEQTALAQQDTLNAEGDKRSAAMINNRIQIIRRLRGLRDHFSQEINQIRELLTQLQLQAELVRLAGTSTDDTRDLVLELVTRIQGLEALMDEC